MISKDNGPQSILARSQYDIVDQEDFDYKKIKHYYGTPQHL